MISLLTEHGVKLIFLVKILILSVILIDETDLFYIGERTSIAADDDNLAQNAQEIPADDQEFVDEETSRRKSFFEELLTLPKVKPEQNKKDELAKYFSIIERKSRQVEDRIKVLKVRQQQLVQLERSIEQKLKKLEDEMAYFQQTQQQEKDLQKERLESLVEFYKKMPPKKAAPVFERLDKDLVVSLFNAFPKKQTMLILSLMNPDKSVELSEYFGRIQSAKEYELLKEINTALLEEFEECKTEPKIE
ncbi:MotE family protein [Pseudobacteriovorax antillogorgiicola]|uniref:Flagellar motility protein MotE, a chaperone for MotC folding n=1 Tax=Pseudobacteriovorax antillogorgiicola TaxID=1513793 RepID=A0A1Y6CJT8_9BACT|nr:hypothetical protein [Pseudobacteriovorax antillogorgiicola]TCS46119.1 flagellar motility protein MotE (MotC chaperone) [Pseudobacteriovorax antillogorgiicola]SMF69524.1 Flagellar motility protein MotE, a chaperone for MotC folding [Pseudobacteriovorax antillogorgiicola]